MWYQQWYKLIRGRQLYYLPQNTVVLNDRPKRLLFILYSSKEKKIEFKFVHFYCLILFWRKHTLIINKQASAASAEGRLQRRAYQTRLGNQESTWLAAEELQSCDATVYLYLRGPCRTACGIINTSCKQHISHGNNRVLYGATLRLLDIRHQDERLDIEYSREKMANWIALIKSLYIQAYIHFKLIILVSKAFPQYNIHLLAFFFSSFFFRTILSS